MLRLTGLPKRYIMVLLGMVALFICYIDRVNMSVAIIPMAEQYGWSATTKGLVLSSFFLGYMLMQIPSGWLANRFGGKWLLGVALIGWSLFTLLTPAAAGVSLAVLLATRVLMGVGEAATMPSLFNLYARWLPRHERTRGVVLTYAGIPLGTIFALSTTGWLISHYGWPSVFYAFGALGLAFALLWLPLVHPSPASHPTISAAERDQLSDCIADARGAPIPWRRLLSSSAVWAVIINHFASNWVLYLCLAWLPSYFRDAQHLTITNAGLFAVGPWLSYFIVGNAGAWIADRAIARGISVTRVRKMAQVTGLLGSAAWLLVASQATTPLGALLTICCALGTLALTGPGFSGNHLDIAPRYADVLYGLSNTAGTIPGIIGVAATGWLLDQTGGYTATFVLAAVVNVIGAAVWVVWASGEPVID